MVGDFTCHRVNGKSTIDYMVASPYFFPLVDRFYVDHMDKSLSDVHCPVCISLRSGRAECSDTINQSSLPDVISSNPLRVIRTKWKNETAVDYKNSFCDEAIEALYRTINNITISTLDGPKMDQIVAALGEIFIEPAVKIGISRVAKSGGRK